MLHPRARDALAHARGDVPASTPGYDVVAHRRRVRAEALAEPREPLAEVRDVDADGVPCRLYLPEDRVAGVLVHLHGGGFVLNDVDVHDNAVRRLADRAGVAVLSVDYRRPPEDPFPAAPDDVDTVLGWLAAHAADLELAGPTFAHGDSAGANLALVAALRNPGRFRALALTYPFLDPEAAGASHGMPEIAFARDTSAWFWRQYAPTAADRANPDVAPLRSDRLHTLPPTLVVTAEGDPLRDEGELLVSRLAELGVEVVGTRYLGQVHGFWRHTDVFTAAEPLTRQIAGWVQQHALTSPRGAAGTDSGRIPEPFDGRTPS